MSIPGEEVARRQTLYGKNFPAEANPSSRIGVFLRARPLSINGLAEKVFTTAGGLGDGGGGDARWWLRWQLELELVDQELEFWLGLV